jgi:hypothetical protein
VWRGILPSLLTASMAPATRRRKQQPGAGKQDAPDAKEHAAAHTPRSRTLLLILLVLLACLAAFRFWSAPAHDGPWFEERTLPGRGTGLIALRDIPQGTLLTREHPAIHGIPLESARVPPAYPCPR